MSSKSSFCSPTYETIETITCEKKKNEKLYLYVYISTCNAKKNEKKMFDISFHLEVGLRFTWRRDNIRNSLWSFLKMMGLTAEGSSKLVSKNITRVNLRSRYDPDLRCRKYQALNHFPLSSSFFFFFIFLDKRYWRIFFIQISWKKFRTTLYWQLISHTNGFEALIWYKCYTKKLCSRLIKNDGDVPFLCLSFFFLLVDWFTGNV